MLVVHIGPHKTATTYIQQNLFANRDALNARGWLYPTEGAADDAAHHHIAHNADLYLEGPEGKVLAGLGARADAAGKNIVLSAEGFCRWTPKQFRDMARIMGQTQVELVYVLRDPLDRLYSHWAEEVKQGYSKSFADRFIENFANCLQSRLLNPMRDLGGLLTLGFKVHVVPFEVLKQDKIDIFQHICAVVLGVPDLPVPDTRPKNAAYPIELTEFLRLLTSLRSQGRPHIGSELRHRFINATTDKDRLHFGNLVKRDARPARRVIRLGDGDFVKRRLELVTAKGLAGRWTLPVEGRSFFQTEEQVFIHYDGLAMWHAPEIRAAVQSISEKLDG